MNPNCWGPNAWYVLHYLALVNDRDGYNKPIASFFTVFISLLMCESCRIHGGRFQKLLADDGRTPDESARSEKLFEYSWILHNLVNTRLKKPPVALEVAREHWRELTIDEQEDDASEADVIDRRMMALWEFLIRVFTHYDQNQELKRADNYKRLISILPALIEAFGEQTVNANRVSSLAASAKPHSSQSLLCFLGNVMDLVDETTSLATVSVRDGLSRCELDYTRSKNEKGASMCEILGRRTR